MCHVGNWKKKEETNSNGLYACKLYGVHIQFISYKFMKIYRSVFHNMVSYHHHQYVVYVWQIERLNLMVSIRQKILILFARNGIPWWWVHTCLESVDFATLCCCFFCNILSKSITIRLIWSTRNWVKVLVFIA